MRRLIWVLGVALCMTAPVGAQQKIKDEGLHQFLIQEFARLNERVEKLNERIAAVEARLTQMEKNQANLAVEEAQTETSLKSTDTSLSSLRLNTQQELFEVKTGVIDLKALLSGVVQQTNAIAEVVKKMSGTPATVATVTPPPPGLLSQVGYLDTTDAASWSINLGTADNVHQGQQFHVYHLNSGDGNETEAGLVEVTEIVEAHKSRVKVVSSKPDVKVDFGDIVRPN